jgi:hypothetical protein
MNVSSHEQTTNTIPIVFISFIDMGQEGKEGDSNTHASKNAYRKVYKACPLFCP